MNPAPTHVFVAHEPQPTAPFPRPFWNSETGEMDVADQLPNGNLVQDEDDIDEEDFPEDEDADELSALPNDV